MASWDAAAVGLLTPAQLDKWPTTPDVVRELECPYRLWSSTPLVVRAHGLLMAAHPFTPGKRGSTPLEQRAYACWCAALSQAVQGVAAALASECENHNRLFWLSDAMIAMMKKMGLETLAGPKHDGGRMLRHLLASIELVKWHLVDPCGTNCAAHTSHGTPVFTAGDAVSWNNKLATFGGLKSTRASSARLTSPASVANAFMAV